MATYEVGLNVLGSDGEWRWTVQETTDPAEAIRIFTGHLVAGADRGDVSICDVTGEDDEDDDPRCTNCGCYRSEHGMEPCDGFTTQPGGFVVYTSDDLEQMTYEEKADLFGWSDRDDEPDDDETEPVYRYRETFRAVHETCGYHGPCSQFDGKPFTLARVIDQPDARHDAECLPMFEIRCEDCLFEAWPEEVLKTETVCPTCNGTGQMPMPGRNFRCRTCDGDGVVAE